MPFGRKLIAIFAILIVIRIISAIPLPFVDKTYLETMRSSIMSSGMIGMMTGASFSRMSLFALSISPYITASIVIQLLTVCVPSLHELQQDGKTGQDKYKKIITWTGIAIALLQAIFTAIGLGRQGLIKPFNPWMVALAALLWTAGAACLILIGNFLDLFGMGNGISWLLLCNIISTIPSDAKAYYELYMKGKPFLVGFTFAFGFLLVFAILIYVCTVISTSTRNVPVVYSGKLAGKISAAKSVIPIPLVTCSVMPIIFAGTLCSMFQMIIQITKTTNPVIVNLAKFLTATNWFNRSHMIYTLGVIPYIALTYLFTAFYLGISFNAAEIANNLKESGATIPGIRAGQATREYLQKIIFDVAMWGNTCLVGIIVAMYAITGFSGMSSISMGSTSAIIVVSILNELFEHVRGEISVRNTSINLSEKKRSKKIYGGFVA